jgi:glutamate-ammonia-ligase adenylyltransferase
MPPIEVSTQGHPTTASTVGSGPGRASSLSDLANKSADPERVQRYLSELSRIDGETLSKVAQDSERLKWLVTVFAFSHFLSEELLRHPSWIFDVSQIDSVLTDSDYKGSLASFLKARGIETPGALDLALFRRRELLRLVIRDGLGIGTVPEITSELSSLADAILDAALAKVTSDLEFRYGCPKSAHETASQSVGFTVLALGKLGGCELNYSSDIDLMFLFGENGETSGPQRITNKEFFKKIANELTTLLSTPTVEGFCYRVDLRLRPEGTLGDVCLSLAAAKDYYETRARDWELQMLIKARVAAGDQTLGQELLTTVEPKIYSTSLDFSTIETMSATRERIAEKLARRRLRKHELDVKLAPGGIRDIEFLVQCLQRLHGARETWVRHGGTALALARLHDKDLLSTTEFTRLSHAYLFLRNLEHRLQFEEDRQTHALPSQPADLERIARRMTSANASESSDIGRSAKLLQELNQHLENVQAIYDRIVHAQRPLYYLLVPSSNSGDDSGPKQAPERLAAGLSEDILRAVAKSAPKLAESVRVRGIHRSENALNCFFESLLEHPEHLDLLESNRGVADAALQIFELSPYLSEQLSRSPDLLQQLRRAVDHPSRLWAFESLAAPLNDIEGLRRFFRQEMFRIQATSICLSDPVFQTLDRTSALAEFVIARAYRIALEKGLKHAKEHATALKPFFDPQNEMMVIALGRLGMREFDLASDADLVFIIPDSEAERQRFWTRVAEHLIDIVTGYTGGGPILTIDTRLRPNGREGMLVQTESKYVEYFSAKAEAWEGIAYMKARAVAGDIEAATSFLNRLQEVDWRHYGQSGRSRQDLRQMRMRLQREQGQVNPLKAGQGGYYDADFILMYLRLKGAGMFFKSLNTPERIDVVEKMGHLERQDAEFLLQATTFFRALDHSLRLVTGRAEEKIPIQPEQQEMIAELMQRWTGEQSRAGNLAAELLAVQTRMRKLFDTIFVQ